jgi:hypothetical protein
MRVCIADTLAAVMNFHSRTRLIGIPWNSWFAFHPDIPCDMWRLDIGKVQQTSWQTLGDQGMAGECCDVLG